MKLTSKQLILLFIVVAIIQVAIPMQLILKQENILKTGTPYKFKTKPIDPTDPFRGKFITLSYAIDRAQSEDSTWVKNQNIYVYLQKDSLNFAQVKKVSKQPNAYPEDYVKATIKYYNKKRKVVYFNLPFNRFYMEEFKAKPAEEIYTESTQETLNDVYTLVYVKEGEAVIDNVFINAIPIADYVEMKNK